MVLRYSSQSATILFALSDKLLVPPLGVRGLNPSLENNFKITSIPKSACSEGTSRVFKNPLIYAVAGYGVFSCVNGGVMRKSFGFKTVLF